MIAVEQLVMEIARAQNFEDLQARIVALGLREMEGQHMLATIHSNTGDPSGISDAMLGPLESNLEELKGLRKPKNHN